MDKYGDEFDGNLERSVYLNSHKTPAYECTPPAMYEIYMLSEGDTPLEFISFITMEIFRKVSVNIEDTYENMRSGERLFCGVYTKDVAETKIKTVTDLAFKNEYPLKCMMRKGRDNVIKKS